MLPHFAKKHPTRIDSWRTVPSRFSGLTAEDIVGSLVRLKFLSSEL